MSPVPNVETKIEHYINLLKTYNEHTNIYSKKAYDKLEFHIQDSLKLAMLIGKSPQDILDMGSGSGLPSVILAIALPHSQVTAVESKRRKTHFLQQAKDSLALENLHVVSQDIKELIQAQSHAPTILTAKAFKPYDQVLKLAKKFPDNPTLYIPVSQTQYQLISKLNVAVDCLNHSPFYYLRA